MKRLYEIVLTLVAVLFMWGRGGPVYADVGIEVESNSVNVVIEGY